MNKQSGLSSSSQDDFDDDSFEIESSKINLDESRQGALHLINMQKFESHISPMIQHIEGEVRPEVSDLETDGDETELAEKACLQWTKQIASALELQLKKYPQGNGPLAEIDFWRERNSAFSALSEQLKLPSVKRMLSILSCTDASRENAILQSFELKCAELTKYHAQATDAVRYLNTLEKHFNNITYGAGFQIVLDTIPSVMNALRTVWVISRHYNNDDRMVPLMEKIAWQLAERVAEVINIRTIFKYTHPEIKARVHEAKKLLELWRECYFEVRAKIEASGRDARWEFDHKRLFERTDYMATVCQDIYNVSQVLEELCSTFGPELKSVTGNPQRIEVLKRVDGLVDPIEKVDFEPFVLKHQFQWKKHMEWFNKEVSTIKDEAKHVISKSFKTLGSAEDAFDLLLKFRYIRSQEAVNAQMMKFSDILLQYDKELDTAHALFKQYQHNPPVSKNQLPVVGAIAWERSLLQRIKHTIIPFQAVEDMITSDSGNVVMIKNLTRFNRNVAGSKPVFQVTAMLSALEILLTPPANEVYSPILNHIHWFVFSIVYRRTENFVCWLHDTCNKIPPQNVEREDEPVISSFFSEIAADSASAEFVTTTSSYMQEILTNLTTYLSRWKRCCPLWKLDKAIMLEKFAARNHTCFAFDNMLPFCSNLANEKVASQPKIQDEHSIQLHMTMLVDTVRDHAKERVNSLETLQEAAKTGLCGLKTELEISSASLKRSPDTLEDFQFVLKVIADAKDMSLTVEIRITHILEPFYTIAKHDNEVTPERKEACDNIHKMWRDSFLESKYVDSSLIASKKKITEIFRLANEMEAEAEEGRHYKEPVDGKDGNLLSQKHPERKEAEEDGEEDSWTLLDVKDNVWTDKLHKGLIPLLKPGLVMVLLYIFCSLDLMCSALCFMGGQEAREVLWDSGLSYSHICVLLFVILAIVGVVLHAGLLIVGLIQQAILLGTSNGASVTAAIVLLGRVCAIPVPASIQQGRKYAFRILILIIWLCCMPGCQGITVMAGHSAYFHCDGENIETSQWRVQRPGGDFDAIGHNGLVYSHYKDQFTLNVSRQSFGSNTTYKQTLILVNATGDDDGWYRCEEEGQIRTLTNLTVEISPYLWLEIDSRALNSTCIDVVADQEYTIQCIAERGKPTPKLSFRVNDEVKTGPLISTSTPSPDGTVTSTLLYIPAEGHSKLTCIAIAQQVLPEQQLSVGVNVQYPPHCILTNASTRNYFEVTCHCEANPDSIQYEIYVNNTLHSTKMMDTVSSDRTVTIYCTGTNDVGRSKSEEKTLTPLHEEGTSDGIIIGIVTVVLVIVIIIVPFLVYKICWKTDSSQHEESFSDKYQRWRSKIRQRKGEKTENGTTGRQTSQELQSMVHHADQARSTMGPDS